MTEFFGQKFITKERGFNNIRILTQDFVRIQGVEIDASGYATVSTTQKTDKKTCQDPDIIKSSLLSIDSCYMNSRVVIFWQQPT